MVPRPCTIHDAATTGCKSSRHASGNADRLPRRVADVEGPADCLDRPGTGNHPCDRGCSGNMGGSSIRRSSSSSGSRNSNSEEEEEGGHLKCWSMNSWSVRHSRHTKKPRISSGRTCPRRRRRRRRVGRLRGPPCSAPPLRCWLWNVAESNFNHQNFNHRFDDQNISSNCGPLFVHRDGSGAAKR